MYVENEPTDATDPSGHDSMIIGAASSKRAPKPDDKGDYDPGSGYPHRCPPKDETCDHDTFMDLRWWSGFWVRLWDGVCNGPDADGKTANAIAHCYAACRIHKEMPECDHAWERSEWKDGKPKCFLSDLDIRNNNIGRDCADAGTDSLLELLSSSSSRWQTLVR